jgi:hypothetical protein
MTGVRPVSDRCRSKVGAGSDRCQTSLRLDDDPDEDPEDEDEDEDGDEDEEEEEEDEETETWQVAGCTETTHLRLTSVK